MNRSPQNSMSIDREFPSDRAFVIQFAKEPIGIGSQANGRIEHISSGQAVRFSSVGQPIDFVNRILRVPTHG